MFLFKYIKKRLLGGDLNEIRFGNLLGRFDRVLYLGLFKDLWIGVIFRLLIFYLKMIDIESESFIVF